MSKKEHLLEIHFAVFLFGMAGLFGKWIALPATLIVLGRVFFATLSLWIILRWRRRGISLGRRLDYLYLALLGVLLAVHWITFFEAIQVSTVAIGLLTFSTFPVFTALLEPLFFRERWLWQDLLLAAVTFGGVALVVPRFDLDSVLTQGALWGVASGMTFAVLSILNRLYVQRYSSLVIAFYQDLVATLVLLPALWWLRPVFSLEEILLLVLLGVVFTATSHTLFINGLKSVEAKTASVIASLEPVYGIIAAAILLGEIPSLRILSGGLVILLATTYTTFRSRKK